MSQGVGNLITLCEDCHRKLHSLTPEQQARWDLPRRAPSYRDAAFMGVMRWALHDELKEMYPNASMSFGHITKNTRIRLGLEKPHVNDACCIAGNLDAAPLDTVVMQKKVCRKNRQLFKANTLKGGIRKKNQAPCIVKGFRLFDKVRYKGQECFITGRRQSGYFVLKLLDETIVHKSAKAADLELIEERKGYLAEREERQFLPRL